MSAEVFYKPVRSIPVEGHTWKHINGFPLPNSRIPIRDGHLPDLSRFVVNGQADPQSFAQLVQISPAEGRTFEAHLDSFSKVPHLALIFGGCRMQIRLAEPNAGVWH